MTARRSAICAEHDIGLTTLYNQGDEGAWMELGAPYRRLDEAVSVAYGWSAGAAGNADLTNARLLEFER